MEALSKLTPGELIERIQRYERIIHNAPREGTRKAYMQARDRLYNRLLNHFENTLSDNAFAVLFSLDNVSFNLNW
jgi:hypothetical protein